MEFDEAKKKLGEMANGKYHALSQELHESSVLTDSKQEWTKSVYVDGYNWHQGATWEIAFESLEKAMK